MSDKRRTRPGHRVQRGQRTREGQEEDYSRTEPSHIVRPQSPATEFGVASQCGQLFFLRYNPNSKLFVDNKELSCIQGKKKKDTAKAQGQTDAAAIKTKGKKRNASTAELPLDLDLASASSLTAGVLSCNTLPPNYN